MNPLLRGVRVLDLSRLLPGPYCTLHLAQLGAEVLKIEEPGGDYARGTPELFDVVNGAKASLVLDLKKPADRDRLRALAARADVLLESFRPGVMARFGLDYESLKAANPRLVYASLTGYGHTGPWRDLAGHDMNYCAVSGVLDQTGAAGGPPVLSNTQVADLAGGALVCATAILAAVLGARASGEGAFLDCAMLDGTLALQPLALAGWRATGEIQPRGADLLTGALPNYGLYQCADGGWLAVGALEPKFFKKVLAGLWDTAPAPLRATLQKLTPARRRDAADGPPNSPSNSSPTGPGDGEPQGEARAAAPAGATLDLGLGRFVADPGRARRLLAPARWALGAVFRRKTRDEWATLLHPQDACVTPVLTLAEAMSHPQVMARGVLRTGAGGKPVFGYPVRFDNAETTTGTSPALGEAGPALAARWCAGD